MSGLPTPPERHRPFWNLVDVRGPDECWPWIGYVSEFGYGKHTPYVGKCVRAHRYAYELWFGRGAVRRGFDLDHTCHTADVSCPGGVTCPHRSCVNPHHLRVASRAENLLVARFPNAAKTHCPQGHPYDGDNLYVNRRGSRECRICRAASIQRFKQARTT